MPARRLAPVFASIIATVACGPRIDEEDFQDHCSEPLLANVTLASRIDAVEVRIGDRTTERIGELCAKATDKAACLASVATAAERGAFGAFLIATSGDEVIVSNGGGAGVDVILGTIDNANEARLAVDVSLSTNACRVRATGNDFEVYGKRSGDNCGSEVAFVVKVSPDATLREVDKETLDEGDDNCSIGRRPAGLRRSAKQPGIGGWFAEVARLEAASVVAFERLADELEAHGAPRSLVRRARRAANDERRHTRMMEKLARRHGAKMRAPKIGPAPTRSLEAMALENAREGCVRETFGALLASWQSRTANDRTIARTMEIIARDETRHAELSWDVGAFLATRLSPRSLAKVARERTRTVERLLAEADRAPEPMLAKLAGLPEPRDARALTNAFVAAVLAA